MGIGSDTNDTCLYGDYQNVFNVVTALRLDDSMIEYLDKVHGLLHDFNEKLPLASTPEQESKCQTFFMMMALYGLHEKYSVVHDQILGS